MRILDLMIADMIKPNLYEYKAAVPYRTEDNSKYWEYSWDWLKANYGSPAPSEYSDTAWQYLSSTNGLAVFGFTTEKTRNWFLLNCGR